jgi:hypothetical protein
LWKKERRPKNKPKAKKSTTKSKKTARKARDRAKRGNPLRLIFDIDNSKTPSPVLRKKDRLTNVYIA